VSGTLQLDGAVGACACVVCCVGGAQQKLPPLSHVCVKRLVTPPVWALSCPVCVTGAPAAFSSANVAVEGADRQYGRFARPAVPIL
jgi:hypothetical protein